MFRFGFVLTVSVVSLLAPTSYSQPPQFAPSTLNAQSSAEPTAVSGEPFGVFIVDVPLPAGVSDPEIEVFVADAGKRSFFPTYNVLKQKVRGPATAAAGGLGIGRPGGLIDRIRNVVRSDTEISETPVAIRIAGLFKGDQPFELQIEGAVRQRMQIVPLQSNPRNQAVHRTLLSRWWQSYVGQARSEVAAGDFPRLVHRYMLSMLSSRLGLPAEDLDPPVEDDDEEEEETVTVKTLSLLAGIDAKREELLEQLLTDAPRDNDASLQVPPAHDWAVDARLTSKQPTGQLPAIEPIATRVPPECFYLRFGSFSNYVWFQELAERFGGDIAQAVQIRGFNAEASARVERMLATKLTTVAKMFGDQLVSDMALIGSDLYMKEGASLGVILHATNPGLLKTTTDSERQKIASSNPAATLQQVQIAGREVSLLSTPDNSIRSFFVADGKFLFVTTSETLVRRFLEVAGSGDSLADSPEFQWTRQWMPEESNYSVFAYFSPRFFHQLVSPKYQIELSRRLEAIGRLEIISTATQAAAAESQNALSIGQLEQSGYLPASFASSQDGARPIQSAGGWIDSLRGARGSFLPIADIEVSSVTEQEAADYAETLDFFAQEWKQMDPMVFGLRRFSGAGKGQETVAFEGYIAPFDADKYGWIGKQLGQPTTVQFRQPASDAVSLQLHMRGGSALATSDQDYYLFAGLKDTTPPDFGSVDGLLKKFSAFANVPAYIGAWPKPDLVESLPLGIGRNFARPDYAGYSKMRIGLWRWQNDTMSLMSFDRNILEEARANVALEQSTDNAQVRLNVVDLTGSQLGRWVDSVWYQRGLAASKGNVKLLNTINQQLRVRPAEALGVAEALLDVKLQCPVGGNYQLAANNFGIPAWVSTAWQDVQQGPNGELLPPPGYSAPWVEWFRGGQLHITQQPDSLAAVGQVDLDMPPLPVDLTPKEPLSLPSLDFNIFSLPGKLFGAGEASEPAPARRKF